MSVSGRGGGGGPAAPSPAPLEALREIQFYNADYTHALDPADLPNLVYGEFWRARKTRLPVTPLSKHENHYTEVGLADRFVAEHWESVLYCSGMKAWLVWNGRIWERDTAGSVRTKAKRTARRLYAEVARIEDDAARLTPARQNCRSRVFRRPSRNPR